ncbi:hypothetical protein B0H16DRAFT_1484232 [Mycena metata]|uniref:Uncharacterized protein n=1 Tax=Mycena metata TaxID=1033252 RepID=A0AAD7GKD7_9AGAR|nr:hypothetical protein B0H16DRAFT_1484232 [Mycena metata]
MATGRLTRGTTQADQIGYIAERLDEVRVAIHQIQMSMGLEPLQGDEISESADAGAGAMEDVEEEEGGNDDDDDDNDSDGDNDVVGRPSERRKIVDLEESDQEGDGGEARDESVAGPSGRASPARGGASRDGSGSGRSITPWVPSGGRRGSLPRLPGGPLAPRASREEGSEAEEEATRPAAEIQIPARPVVVSNAPKGRFAIRRGRELRPVGEEVAALVNEEFRRAKDEPKESEIPRVEEVSGSGPEASGSGTSRPSEGGDGSESGRVDTRDAAAVVAVAHQLFPEGEDPEGEVDLNIDQDVPMPDFNAPNEGSGEGESGSGGVGIGNGSAEVEQPVASGSGKPKSVEETRGEIVKVKEEQVESSVSLWPISEVAAIHARVPVGTTVSDHYVVEDGVKKYYGKIFILDDSDNEEPKGSGSGKPSGSGSGEPSGSGSGPK